MIQLACFPYEELLPFMHPRGKKKLTIDTYYGSIKVTIRTPRLVRLARNPKCVQCRRVGKIWILEESNPPKYTLNCFIEDCKMCAAKHIKYSAYRPTPHLNLYHINKRGKLLLMTGDHIIPRSAGGPDKLENLQTMCHECNQFKSSLMPEEFELVITGKAKKHRGGIIMIQNDTQTSPIYSKTVA